MAKSLRSKWKRKMRAIKREQYGKKELARLKKMLGIEDENGDIEMKNISTIATVVDAKSIPSVQDEPSKENAAVRVEEGEEVMEVDKVKEKYNKRTMRNEHGNYPQWMSSREVRRRAIANKVRKQKQKKKKGKDKLKKKK
ncbi:protein LLP homolog [Periplaneta americana]|uniref:protein LLP homolog n=1 Tax=Periplaneta americana TaxID=6978 RepID=UPI0037E89769